MKRNRKEDLREMDLKKYLAKKSWLQDVTDHLIKRYGVSLDNIVKDYKFYSYNLFKCNASYEGIADLPGKFVELGSFDMITTEDINLGVIVHELSHVCQKMSNKWDELNPNILLKIAVKFLGSKKVKQNFYWNNPVEVDARESVEEFERNYNYKELGGR